MKKFTVTVKLPFKAGRLNAPGIRVFRDKKRYTRKTKHPAKEQN